MCPKLPNRVATQLQLTTQLSCHDPKAMSRHTNDCLCLDMKNHVATQNRPGPSLNHVATQELISRHKAKGSCRARTKNPIACSCLSCAHHASRRTRLIVRPPARPRAWPVRPNASARPNLSRPRAGNGQ